MQSQSPSLSNGNIWETINKLNEFELNAVPSSLVLTKELSFKPRWGFFKKIFLCCFRGGYLRDINPQQTKEKFEGMLIRLMTTDGYTADASAQCQKATLIFNDFLTQTNSEAYPQTRAEPIDFTSFQEENIAPPPLRELQFGVGTPPTTSGFYKESEEISENEETQPAEVAPIFPENPESEEETSEAISSEDEAFCSAEEAPETEETSAIFPEQTVAEEHQVSPARVSLDEGEFLTAEYLEALSDESSDSKEESEIPLKEAHRSALSKALGPMALYLHREDESTSEGYASADSHFSDVEWVTSSGEESSDGESREALSPVTSPKKPRRRKDWTTILPQSPMQLRETPARKERKEQHIKQEKQ